LKSQNYPSNFPKFPRSHFILFSNRPCSGHFKHSLHFFCVALPDNQQSVSTAYSHLYKIVSENYFSKTVTAASSQKFLHMAFIKLQHH